MNSLVRLSDVEKKAENVASMFEDSGMMYKYAPALFAKSAHPKMSERYAFTNTYDVLLHMHNRGFRVTSVMGGTSLYNKVMVRMRNTHVDARNGVAPELVVLDSHDGSCRLKMFLGIIKFACMNGCIAGDILFARTYTHIDVDLMAKVMLDLGDIDASITTLNQRVDAMRSYKTTVGERFALADVATRERFGADKDGAFVADLRSNVLRIHREEDKLTDLFTVMNVVQENIIRGGGAYVGTHNRLQRMRAIGAVDRNLHINQRLWLEAERIMTRASESAKLVSEMKHSENVPE